MNKLGISLACGLALGGCVEVQQATDSAARSTAERVAIETVFIGFPNIPKSLTEPAARCVVQSATPQEVRTLAGAAVTGITDATVQTTRNILARPEGAQCLTSAAVSFGVTL